MDIIYKGQRFSNGGVEVVVMDGEREIPLRPRNIHSPCFEWGYAGSGPAELATAIIADAIRRGIIPEDARWFSGDFKWEVVAALPHQGWALNGAKIHSWWEEVKRTFALSDET